MNPGVLQSVEKKLTGFYIGNRLILPFRCQVIKVIYDGEIYTDFTSRQNDVIVSQEPVNTSIYIDGKYVNLVGRNKPLKLIVCDWNADLADLNNHIKLICDIEENHKVVIHKPDADMLFIE